MHKTVRRAGIAISDPYKRLLAYFDQQVEQDAYDPTPVLYRRGVKGDADTPTCLVVDIYVTVLTLPKNQRVMLMADEDRTVEWFELDLGVLGVHRITLDRQYHDDDAHAINACLASAGL